MSDIEMDRLLAGAEAALDRVDDADADLPDVDTFELQDGMHVEEAGSPIVLTDDDDDSPHVTAEASEVLDEFAEAFNARDIDAMTDMCADDCEIPGLASDLDELPEAMADLWERRPTVTLTREVVDEQAVGVLWEREDTAGWAPLGTLHVDLMEDSFIGVLEFSDDVGLLDELSAEPPDGDLAQGYTWSEWDEGAE